MFDVEISVKKINRRQLRKLILNEMYNMEYVAGPPMSQQPLDQGALMELIAADQDPASSYNIKGRLEILHQGNLSDEEREIIAANRYGYAR